MAEPGTRAKPLATWLEAEGALLRLRLNRPKANIVDAAMIGALQQALDAGAGAAGLKAVLLDAEGPHFSFGASVEEHLPDRCEAMLRGLHRLVRTLLGYPVPVLVAIRGQCLGGGLEVAAAGHLLFATPESRLGQPEIQLAVFAPAASCLLPERIGPARAEDLLYSGRSISGEQAEHWGLVNRLDDDPSAGAQAYFHEHLAPRSASSLRLAVSAARADLVERVDAKLARVESLYLERLMRTHDAVEGLQAFIDKRAPAWRDA